MPVFAGGGKDIFCSLEVGGFSLEKFMRKEKIAVRNWEARAT